MNADKTRIDADKIGIISAWVAECAVQPTIDVRGELESPLRSGLKLLALRAGPLRNLDRARALWRLAGWVTSGPERRVWGEPYARYPSQ